MFIERNAVTKLLNNVSYLRLISEARFDYYSFVSVVNIDNRPASRDEP